MKQGTPERRKRHKEKPSPATTKPNAERPAETAENPLVPLAGKFAGEEWEALLEAIRCNRQAIDAPEANGE